MSRLTLTWLVVAGLVLSITATAVAGTFSLDDRGAGPAVYYEASPGAADVFAAEWYGGYFGFRGGLDLLAGGGCRREGAVYPEPGREVVVLCPGGDASRITLFEADLLDGDDEVWGGSRRPLPFGTRLFGGEGDDLLFGLESSDLIDGGPGDDYLDEATTEEGYRQNRSRDTFLGGPGEDRILAADGEPDVVDCGPGFDRAQTDRRDTRRGCEADYFTDYMTDVDRLAPGIVHHRWRTLHGRYTEVVVLKVVPVPRGHTVVASCRGSSCPLRRRRYAARPQRRPLRLTPLFRGARLRPPARVTVEIALRRANRLYGGRRVVFRMRSRQLPLVRARELRPR